MISFERGSQERRQIGAFKGNIGDKHERDAKDGIGGEARPEQPLQTARPEGCRSSRNDADKQAQGTKGCLIANGTAFVNTAIEHLIPRSSPTETAPFQVPFFACFFRQPMGNAVQTQLKLRCSRKVKTIRKLFHDYIFAIPFWIIVSASSVMIKLCRLPPIQNNCATMGFQRLNRNNARQNSSH